MEKKKVSRRDFLRIASVAAVGAAFAGCSPAKPTAVTTGGDVTQAVPVTQGQVTLRMWHWDSFLQEGYKQVLEKFTEKNPNIKVNFELTAYGEYSQKVAASIAGGAPPDVVGTVGEHFTNMAGQGSLIDLKQNVEGSKFDLNDYHPGNLSQNTWGGKLLAIPYTADGMWWYYNADEFKKKGLKTPYEYWKEGTWDWTAATELAKQLTSGEGVTKNFGYGGLDYGNYYDILPTTVSNGGTGLFDEKYTASQLSNPKFVELLQWGLDMRPYAPGPEDQATSNPESGRVMQWMDWSPMGPSYSKSFPFKFSYAPPPPSPATKKLVFCGDAPAFGILKGVKYPDQSWMLIQWINTPESTTTIFNVTGQEPPRMSVATSESLWMNNKAFPDAQIGHELTVTRFKEGFLNTPKVSNFAEMWQAYREEISLAWADKQSLQEAVTKANDRINELLKESTVDQDKLYWTG
jgi:multiple sugar transport system substrate-binding protein